MRPSASLTRLMGHPAVDECEDAFMDGGRFFVHLKRGWCFTGNGCADHDCQTCEHGRSVGGAVEGLKLVCHEVRPCDCARCAR